MTTFITFITASAMTASRATRAFATLPTAISAGGRKDAVFLRADFFAEMEKTAH